MRREVPGLGPFLTRLERRLDELPAERRSSRATPGLARGAYRVLLEVIGRDDEDGFPAQALPRS